MLRFDRFEFDPTTMELTLEGAPVRIGAQPARLLALFLSRPGSIVSREEIVAAVWGERTHVDFEQGINACIRQLRVALGDDAETPRFVATLPRRGYRFVATVAAAGAEPPPPRFRWGAAAVLAVVPLALLWLSVSAGPSRAPTRLAILPFVTLDGAASDDALADGLTEELITEVSRRYGRRLGVLARTSVMTFKGSRATIAEIGLALDAEYLLEGSVRRDGERVRVTAQLVRASDHGHVWAGSYDRPLDDLLALEAELGRTIARALAIELIAEPDPAGPAAAVDAAAWSAYLEAHALLEARPPRPRKAIPLLRDALARAPGFARAWTDLARALSWSLPPREARTQVADALDRALALDDTLAAAHRFRGNVRLYADWDVAAAQASFDRALELGPADAETWHDAAACAAIAGRHDEARRDVARALELDPLSPAVLSDVGWYAYFDQDWAAAQEGARRTLAVDPDEYWAQTVAVLAATAQGDVEGALVRARENLRLRKVDEEPASVEAYWRLEASRLGRAGAPGSPDLLALARMGFGDREGALDALERAAEERKGWMLPFLHVIPAFDPLHGDPRYERLVERVGVAALSARASR